MRYVAAVDGVCYSSCCCMQQAMSLADSQSLTAELKQRSQELHDARQLLQDKEQSMQQLK